MTHQYSPALQHALNTIGQLNKEQINNLNISMSIVHKAPSDNLEGSLTVLLNGQPLYSVKLKKQESIPTALCSEG